MKTAVEWLAERCGLQGLEDVIAEAKEIEKEQIIDAWFDGVSNWDNVDGVSDWDNESTAEQYYNETFKLK